ncbi:putative AC transposase [Purpureocillium lavendulum]|uniref:AC transposase n=1 Tax=Purpureocillium lavendulum TaxID=1247861 RepID=A0AB34FVY7_9HYPO|nr:putative AC transposase [Purpureocillium lavendulum]
MEQSGTVKAAVKSDVSEHAPITYTASPAIQMFSVPPADLLASRPDIHNVIAGAMVFRSPSADSGSGGAHREVLLLRRAASDSFPLKWEIPAGTADPMADRSIIEVAVRELWEETQLRARRLHRAVGMGLPQGVTEISCTGDVQDARMDAELPMSLLRLSGRTWAVVTFLTGLEDDNAEVLLREDEHVDWAWVTRDEVREGRFHTGANLDLVSEAMKMILLEGFRVMEEIHSYGHLLRNRRGYVGRPYLKEHQITLGSTGILESDNSVYRFIVKC